MIIYVGISRVCIVLKYHGANGKHRVLLGERWSEGEQWREKTMG